MTILYGIPNCDTVRRARSWLDTRSIGHHFHDYKRNGIESKTLDRWADALGWERLLNRAGMTFRKLPEDEKTGIDRTKAIALMIAQPSLIRRPVVEGQGVLLIGFKPDAWTAAFA